MTEIKSIEHLLHFMQGNIHLSRYDEKFIENISTLKQVTTNQVVLFHSLIDKYRRQLVKHELYPEQLYDLPWNVTVIESSPKYTNGHINIVDNMIYFKCPFSRKFIDEFRKEPHNKYVFNKEERRYETPYSQYSLKILLKIAPKFFNSIELCDVSKKLLDDVEQYKDVKYWNPTLVRLNGHLYIAGINNVLNDAIGDISLNTDIHTIAKLSSYGITISDDLYDKNVLIENIAANSIINIEQASISSMIATLKELNCDMVYVSGAGLLNIAKKQIIENLSKYDIPYSDVTNKLQQETTKNYKFPVHIKLRKTPTIEYELARACKIIHIVNSLPIDIK